MKTKGSKFHPLFMPTIATLAVRGHATDRAALVELVKIAHYAALSNPEHIGGQVLSGYDHQQNQTYFEWVFPDKRFGMVFDEAGTSSWFVVYRDKQSESGSINELDIPKLLAVLFRFLIL